MVAVGVRRPGLSTVPGDGAAVRARAAGRPADTVCCTGGNFALSARGAAPRARGPVAHALARGTAVQTRARHARAVGAGADTARAVGATAGDPHAVRRLAHPLVNLEAVGAGHGEAIARAVAQSRIRVGGGARRGVRRRRGGGALAGRGRARPGEVALIAGRTRRRAAACAVHAVARSALSASAAGMSERGRDLAHPGRHGTYRNVLKAGRERQEKSSLTPGRSELRREHSRDLLEQPVGRAASAARGWCTGPGGRRSTRAPGRSPAGCTCRARPRS